MSTEKRFVLASVISLAILFGYQKLMPKTAIENSVNLTSTDQNNATVGDFYDSNNTSIDILNQNNNKTINENLEFKTKDFGEISIVYSSKGAYIKEIIINKYNERISFDNFFLISEYLDKDFKIIETEESLKFNYNNEVVKKFTIKDNYLLEYQITSSKENSIVYLSQEKSEATSARYQEFIYNIDEYKKAKWSKLKKILPIYNKAKYFGLKDRYYLALFQNTENIQIDHSNNKVTFYEKSKLNKKGDIYLGPQLFSELKKIQREEIVKRGFIGNILFKILSFFFMITKNWGLSIILLALCVYIICFPLTSKSTQSMKKMQELQPKMEKLKEKYKEDPQAMQQETIKLYGEHKVNPMSGCLPLFLQMPIFISLYQLLFKFVELKGARFLWIQDLSVQDYLIHLPNKLPLVGDGIHLLPLIMAGMTFLQQKLTSSGNEMTEQQRTMIMIMPVMLLFIFYRFPAGLVLYWLTNSILTCAYQIYLAKKNK